MLGLLILLLIVMTKQVYINIKELVQVRPLPMIPLTGTEFQKVPSIPNAFLVIEDNTVLDFGNMDSFDQDLYQPVDIIDMSGRFVLPAFCDSHTHAVFARPRETEFVDKIKGLSYQEITAIMETSLSSVESLMFRAKKNLQKTLGDYYKKNKSKGLEVIGLSFEYSEDMKISGPKIKNFISKIGIPYPIVLAGKPDDSTIEKVLPMLHKINGYPTTIIIDKQGKVREIHTGFSGPGTGVYYTDWIQEFDKTIQALLIEKP